MILLFLIVAAIFAVAIGIVEKCMGVKYNSEQVRVVYMLLFFSGARCFLT
jgi:heme/copper-type cytochrome/quinol oxidase subunit 1